MWLLSLSSILGIFYLGIIGSKLHPLQSASDLAKAPLINEVSNLESEILTDSEIIFLIGNACTRVGILVGFIIGIFLFYLTNLSWYWVVGISLIILVLIGSILKFVFKTV